MSYFRVMMWKQENLNICSSESSHKPWTLSVLLLLEKNGSLSMCLAEKLSHWNTNSKQALVTAKQKWQPQPCGSLEYNGLLMGLKSQTTDCNQNFNWKFFVPSLTYCILLSHSLMSHFYLSLSFSVFSGSLSPHTNTFPLFCLPFKTRTSQRPEDHGLHLSLYLLHHSACACQTGRS